MSLLLRAFVRGIGFELGRLEPVVFGVLPSVSETSMALLGAEHTNGSNETVDDDAEPVENVETFRSLRDNSKD